MHKYIDPNAPAQPLNFEDCPEIVRKYISYIITIKNNTRRTALSYYIDIHLFLRFYARLTGIVSENARIEEIKVSKMTAEQICQVKAEDITMFLYYLAEDRNNSPRTRRHKIVSLRRFYGFLCKTEHLIEVNPADTVELPSSAGEKTKIPKYLHVDESQKLLDSVSGEFPERDKCILAIFLTCGIRLSELSGINLSDIASGMIHIRGKGRKERLTYLNALTENTLASYIEKRAEFHEKLADKDALFVSRRTYNRLKNRQIEYIVTKCIQKAGLSYTGCTTHSLRHTAATTYRQEGADLRVLQDLLGHSSLQVTQIYAHVDNKEIAETIRHSPLR